MADYIYRKGGLSVKEQVDFYKAHDIPFKIISHIRKVKPTSPGDTGLRAVSLPKKGSAQGWHKQPELHAEAARRGWEERRQRLGR